MQPCLHANVKHAAVAQPVQQQQLQSQQQRVGGPQQQLSFAAASRRLVLGRARPDVESSTEEVTDPFAWKIKRGWQASDGTSHIGSSLNNMLSHRSFPGPPPDVGPPLRVLPIGGLGEIGMNCMLVGVKDRYIMIDAGLLFPDISDLGMQKILPDVTFLNQWRDKIEAVVITHGHEDHIGALPWVIPALDPKTPVFAGSFVMQLVARRLQEYNLYNPDRFKVIDMLQDYKMGPFTVTPLRVTHSIPDCCGLIMRSDHGTIVHTGDWKIDEDPVDGQVFDRTTFDLLSKEPVSLMMSDSTNVLTPGRTPGEVIVRDSLAQKVLDHQGKGRVVVTQFASNLHRLASVKAAADASGRKICFIGTSLHTYLEAAWRDKRAPIDPADLVKPDQLRHMDPNDVLIVTTGSQAEPRAQLSLASRSASQNLKISPQDLILYSAKVIPGNETKVAEMLNSLAMQGARVMAGRSDNLHVSGHAYQGELEEVLRFVKPQHFLPVHGEYSFLVEHARLAKEKAGVNFTEVIKNGQMLGVWERRNRNTLSMGSMAAATAAADAAAAAAAAAESAATAAAAAAPAGVKGKRRTVRQSRVSRKVDAAEAPAAQQEVAAEQQLGAVEQQQQQAGVVDEEDRKSGMAVIGEVELLRLFNDGGKGTGTASEMAIQERETMAFEGIVVVAVDLMRPKGTTAAAAYNASTGAAGVGGSLTSRARITTRGMWTDNGRLLEVLHKAVQAAVARLPATASLSQVEADVIEGVQKASRWFNNRKPEVIAVAWEHDPRHALLPDMAVRAMPQQQQRPQQQQQRGSSVQQAAGAGAFASSNSRQDSPRGGGGSIGAAPASPNSSSSGSSGSGFTGEPGSSSSSSGGGRGSTRRAPPRVRRAPGGAKQLPPLQVLPRDVELPVTHKNPRQNPAAAGPDADLAYD